MILTEYDEELHNETLREEGREDGIEEGIKLTKREYPKVCVNLQTDVR